MRWWWRRMSPSLVGSFSQPRRYIDEHAKEGAEDGASKRERKEMYERKEEKESRGGG